MRFFGILYLLVGILFFFFPNEIFYLINVGPKVFKITEAIPDSNEHFWLALSASMMAMLSALSFLAAESPSVRGYPLVHILSKVVSSMAFIHLFMNDHRYFAYILGVITDLPIALVVMWITLRLGRPQPAEEAA